MVTMLETGRCLSKGCEKLSFATHLRGVARRRVYTPRKHVTARFTDALIVQIDWR